jgi:hypothetical protein
MTGMSDFTARAAMQAITGQSPFPAPATMFLALMTAVGTDANTGFTECVGTNYARVQVAGSVAATASFTTGVSTWAMTTNPGWVVPGMNVYDNTNGFQIGTVLTYIGTTLVITANAAHASAGTTDSLLFSAFAPAAASAPSTDTTGAVINFAQAGGAGWGTAIAWALYDLLAAGNLWAWDYLGNFTWNPTTVSLASPGILTVKAHGYAAADPIIFSTEYGGTAPSFSQSNFTGVLNVVSPATDSFSVTNAATAVNTSSTGSGMVRKITQQPIAANVTPSFAAASFNLSAA